MFFFHRCYDRNASIAEFVPPHHYRYLLFISKFFFFFLKNLYFILPVSAIVGMSESIWSDVGVGGFCFVFVTLSPGCILNVAKFLSTVKFVVLSWGSLVIAVLCSLSAVAAAE